MFAARLCRRTTIRPVWTQRQGPSPATRQPPRQTFRTASVLDSRVADNTGPSSGGAARTADIKHNYPPPRDLHPSRPAGGTTPAPSRLTLGSFSLEGKTVVVTGGARGLGLVMGQGIVSSGADLAIVDLNVDEARKQAEALTEQFRRHHPNERLPKITAHIADVSDETSVNACVDDILAAHGKIDNLVTSAGIVENFPAVDYSIDRVRRLWGINVDGTYLFATAVARHLMHRRAPGSLVLIGSMSGAIVNVPQPQAPYNASKAAVRQLAASLAVEWAPERIRVNCISPGYMLTALTQKILDDNPPLKKQWISLIPQGRMGNPEDLMGPVTFLLSDASRYVTGADLRVDGGYTIT